MSWDEIQRKLTEMGVEYGPSVLGALATWIGGWIAAKLVRAILKRILRKARVDDTLIGFVGNMAYMLMLAFVIVSALGTLGMQTGSFVAILGAAGLAIGFALQGSLSNLAAGVMIILFRPFRKGDFIAAAGSAGDVEEIQVFSTILNTKDNKRIIVPNSALMGDVITNFSANKTRRVDLVMGIGYGDDLLEAKRILMDILRENAKVLKDPEPVVAIAELADSSVNFHVRPWCRPEDYWAVWSEVTEAVKLRFDAAGISIPFPQQDVHMHQVA